MFCVTGGIFSQGEEQNNPGSSIGGIWSESLRWVVEGGLLL